MEPVKICMTRGIADAMSNDSNFPWGVHNALERFTSNDFGKANPDENDDESKIGVYEISGRVVWVMWNYGELITVLFPDEY